MDAIDVITRAKNSGGGVGDGSFEKCAQASLSLLLPLLGAGAGAGVGAYSNKVRPEDEDEDSRKRKLDSILFGTGGGALGGAGLAALLSLAGVNGIGAKEKPSFMSHFDPSWRTMAAALGLGNAIVPSDGVHSFRRIFNPTKDTRASGTWAGTVRDRLNGWRKWKAIAFGYDPVDPKFNPGLLFGDANKANISSILDRYYAAARGNAGKAERAAATTDLFKNINSVLKNDSSSQYMVDLEGYLRGMLSKSDPLSKQFQRALRAEMARSPRARADLGTLLRAADNSVIRENMANRVMGDIGGERIFGNLAKWQQINKAKASRGFFGRLRHPVARTASGAIGLAALFPSLFGIVAPEKAPKKGK